MSINKEYDAPPKDYQNQTYGNRPNEFVENDPDSRTRFLIEEILKSVRTSMPGIVQQSFEKDGAVWCEVQPGLSAQKRGGEEFVLPIIRAPLGRLNVGGLEVDVPSPVQGDEVAIICADRSIATFVKDAGVGVPKSVSILNLNNAWILPVSFSNVKRKRFGEPDRFTMKLGEKKIEFTADGFIVNGGTNKAAGVDDTTISDASVDSSFWGAFTAFMTVITGAPIPEPGNGAPSAFQTALAAAIAGAGGAPTSLAGKIDSGSDDLLIT